MDSISSRPLGKTCPRQARRSLLACDLLFLHELIIYSADEEIYPSREVPGEAVEYGADSRVSARNQARKTDPTLGGDLALPRDRDAAEQLVKLNGFENLSKPRSGAIQSHAPRATPLPRPSS